MKKILFSALIWIIINFLSFSQSAVKIYPYPMIPSEHPDYFRYHVQSPDASLFGNKTEFIALRDLSENYKEKLDIWINKDKLGKIL